MSFGWSVGDVIAGIKVVYDVYQAVSDGPINAQREAVQFYEEFGVIVQCLEEWKSKAQFEQDEIISDLHQQLTEQCEKFVKRHMLLIKEANPRTEAARDGRSTWLRNVPFSRDQVVLLYQRVQWPWERDEVSRLRKKLKLFLQVATHKAMMETHDMVRDIRDSNFDILSQNLRLRSSHLDLVSLITLNLRRVAKTDEANHLANQIDGQALRQFERAILPPPPIRAIEASPTAVQLPWQSSPQRQIEDRYESVLSLPATYSSGTSRWEESSLDQDERLISERLENIGKRGALPTRPVASELNSTDDKQIVVQRVLERLRDLRNRIGEAVGVPTVAIPDDYLSPAVLDPQRALMQDLAVWNQFEERVQYEVRRTDHFLAQMANKTTRNPSPSASISTPIPIPSPRMSPTLSPMSQSPSGTSPSDSFYGSPENNQRMFLHNRPPSMVSSAASSILLTPPIPVQIQCQNQAIQGAIQSFSRFDDGEVYLITTSSHDGSVEVRHAVDRQHLSPTVETSMKPFLDNGHVDKIHKYRVQFQGSHVLRFVKRDHQGQQLHKITMRCPPMPIYKFNNREDYLEFQSHILGKEVVFIADIDVIKSNKEKESQCRLATIRILVDPIYKTRSILYFRVKTKDHPLPGFVEWPTSVFKEPKEPTTKCKTLVLDSCDGKSLSATRSSLSRRSTQGSVTTIGSFESSTAAYSRLQERGSGRSIKGLVIEFYDATDCHNFWKEFVKKEDLFAQATEN